MMPTSGATHCFACGLGAFNYARGRATCTSCPALTRTLELRSASELDCLCAVGSFDAHGCAGVECEHCPQGATCYGGRNAPASNAGMLLVSLYVEIYICACMHIYMCTYIHIYTYTYVHIYVCPYTHMYKYTQIHIYSHTHIHIYTYTHIHIYTYTHIHIYTCTHMPATNTCVRAPGL